MSFDFSAIYRSTRERFSSFVVELDRETLQTLVPATPLWTVHDVIAHVAGVASDIVTGRMDGAVSDAWTQRQVDERKGHTVADIAEEWSECGSRVETILGEVGPSMSATVMDAWMHEHDVYGALQSPGRRNGEGLRLCLRAANAIGPKLEGADLPALHLHTDGYDRSIGAGQPVVTVSGDAFDIARALFGRRSISQIAAFDWTGDPTPYLEHFSVFESRQTDLIE